MPTNHLSKKDAEMLALLKVLSGSLRFRILVLLRAHPAGMIVSDIADILGGSASRISHQLSILRRKKLVTATGLDHEVRYALNDHRLQTMLGFNYDA